TATFSGLMVGLANTTLAQATLTGNASLTADFGAQTVSADFTSIAAAASNIPTQNWNPLHMTASITPGTNQFSGTVVSTAASALSPAPLTGTGNGRFFGPQAQEAAGVLQVQGGGTTALASFGVKR